MARTRRTYRTFAGAFAGPVLLVRGSIEVKRMMTERLKAISSLDYMRGAILIAGDNDESLTARRLEIIDDELVVDTPDATSFFEVLRRATELGMIAGRGVPGGSDLALA